MGNSRAYPVLRTADLRRAYAVARQLLALADLRWAEVSLAADTRSYEVDRYLRAFPGGLLWLTVPAELVDVAHPVLAPYVDPANLADLRFLEGVWLAPEVGAECLAALRRLPDLPVEFELPDQPVGDVEERFLPVVGADRGSVRWESTAWPPVEELDLGWQVKYAEVQITVNSTGVDHQERSAEHTLYVHVGAEGEKRARWLADRVGLAVVGPEEAGF
ncbi:hypothetical protein [Plantactinospora sp. CA-290183]|uniref:hypothetical protein n=1 Tax=Plantactinospora sp. CA-290183 TaxID=3240006 RepID=UPI003D8EBA5A